MTFAARSMSFYADYCSLFSMNMMAYAVCFGDVGVKTENALTRAFLFFPVE